MSVDAVTLRVEGVTKRFGDFTAVDGLSFDVRPGRVFGFLGPNGAGKTTTIRMIVGITKPDSGRIEYGFAQTENGERITENSGSSVLSSQFSVISSFQDRIGYLPEERGLYKKLKVV